MHFFFFFPHFFLFSWSTHASVRFDYCDVPEGTRIAGEVSCTCKACSHFGCTLINAFAAAICLQVVEEMCSCWMVVSLVSSNPPDPKSLWRGEPQMGSPVPMSNNTGKKASPVAVQPAISKGPKPKIWMLGSLRQPPA